MHMAKPMMLQDADDTTIQKLKILMGARTKIEVVRQALRLLAQRIDHQKKIAQWKKAARMASSASYKVLQEFQPYSRLKKHE